ncbi:hypothetical protein ASD01_05910 [Ensifer sp. Root423]|jgi:hypothetical protein|uniref:hypothetical protein n=1 Tax=unclassified Ensifer TaxID=2633371 RepID=UPI0007149B70|nr:MULTISPECIES: hypothetical protein [unclassified Ensifer]KQX16098.1 hypothetical protein ASD01_05910 [Ensifer sp. Root423]SFG47511.1 hypothetical protein SAMN05216459_10672 [Ensifer sp. OV372]
MSEIRSLDHADVPAVAGMFQRVFRDERTASPALADYMRQLYLHGPGCDPGIRPLVHVNDEGRITGFVGVNALPMTLNGRHLRAAICGSLMAEDRESDPLAGARLMKAFLAGPQDLSFSETASEVSVQMWTRLRGVVLPQYSLDWVRVIRPATFSLSVASNRIKPARLAAPFARALDRFYRKRMGQGEQRWSALPEAGAAPAGFTATETDRSGFAAVVDQFTAPFPLRPEWSDGQLDHILADAEKKPEQGELAYALVTARTGAVVGAFAYYVKAGEIGRVLQILARPGQAGPVIDCLVDEASRRGLAGLRGRTQPALMEAMLGRRIAFVHVASTVVHSRDQTIVEACRDGQGFFNGISGEYWSRLIGGSFD